MGKPWDHRFFRIFKVTWNGRGLGKFPKHLRDLGESHVEEGSYCTHASPFPDAGGGQLPSEPASLQGAADGGGAPGVLRETGLGSGRRARREKRGACWEGNPGRVGPWGLVRS